jgi:hypothetical protein
MNLMNYDLEMQWRYHAGLLLLLTSPAPFSCAGGCTALIFSFALARFLLILLLLLLLIRLR